MKEFELLYRDAFKKVYCYVYMLSHDHSLSEDITQDTFVKAYEHFIVSGKSLNITWLYTVARNRFITLQRRKKFFIEWKGKEQEEFHEMLLEGIVDSAETPEEWVLKQEEQELVREVLFQLSEQFRTALILREFDEMGLKEITTILGVKESYGKQLLYKAREKFKILYEIKIREMRR